MASVNFEEQVRIPLRLTNLKEFRRWCHSGSFPENGRIDYIQGDIEVDMSPEDFFTHGTPKTEIVGVLYERVKKQRLGHLLVDRTRIASLPGNLSAEPDILFVARETLSSGRVRLVPKASGAPDRYIELEGAPDLIVEIVSDSSVVKDTTRLPQAYFHAGVSEFWLVDARGESIDLRIHGRGESGFEAVSRDSEGFQWSELFACGFQLNRSRDKDGYWEYDLNTRE